MQQLNIFDNLDNISAKHDINDYIYSLTNGDFIEMDTVKESSQKYRFRSINKGDKRAFLVYDRKFIDGVWKEFNPISGGFWGIDLDQIMQINKIIV